MGIPVLKITDGTTTINLLAGAAYGFHLLDWSPVIVGYKGGGTVQDSPLADGRRLVDKKFEDGIEAFTLRANQRSQDTVIRDMQDLLRLLEQATDYWAGWYDTPVYLEAQSSDETNTRYAIIRNYQMGELNNPFSQPFLQPGCAALYDEFILTVERGPWTSNVPGTGTATAAAAYETYDGRTLGNVDSSGAAEPTTDAAVYVANKHNVANLTHVWWSDASLTAFSSNLMDAALPFDLFPTGSTPNVQDACYFGISTGVTDYGPFCSLIFDIGTPAVYNATLTWEYWNGAWTTLPNVYVVADDGTVESSTTYFKFGSRVTSVSWKQPSDWATTSVNSVTAYWVRVRITAQTSWTTNPQQQNRDIYSVPWAYTRITSDQVLGDLPALLRARLTQRNGNMTDAVTATTIDADRVIVALRSESRGTTFTPYLNCTDNQELSNMSVFPGTNTTIVTNPIAPTGESATYNPTGAESIDNRFEILLGSTLAPQYYGTFRLFLRAQQEGGSVGDIQVRIAIAPTYAASDLFQTDTLSFTNVDQQELLDFGQVVLPGLPVASSDSPQIEIRIQASAASGTPNLHMYDVILMPVDEWAGEFLNPLVDDGDDGLDKSATLDVDSIYPRQTIRSLLRGADVGDLDTVQFTWSNITNGPAILQANANQRLWFLAARKVNSAWYADFEVLSFTQVTHNRRYFSARGDR